MRKKVKILFVFIGILLGIVVVSNYAIESFAHGKTYDKVSTIEKNKVGLVLGTSKMLQNGRINLYFNSLVSTKK